MRIITMTAFALSMAMAGTAFAQSSSGTSGSSGVGSTPSYEATKGPNGAVMSNPSTMSSASNPSTMSRTNVEKLRQQLSQAGLQDVKVLDTSYLVQAKTQDGTPVIMVINPPNPNTTAMSSDRDATTTGSVRSGSGMSGSSMSNPSMSGKSGMGASGSDPSSSATPDKD